MLTRFNNHFPFKMGSNLNTELNTRTPTPAIKSNRDQVMDFIKVFYSTMIMCKLPARMEGNFRQSERDLENLCYYSPLAANGGKSCRARIKDDGSHDQVNAPRGVFRVERCCNNNNDKFSVLSFLHFSTNI